MRAAKRKRIQAKRQKNRRQVDLLVGKHKIVSTMKDHCGVIYGRLSTGQIVLIGS